MDPTDRFSAEQALQHPYVAKFSDPSDEVCLLLFNTLLHVLCSPLVKLYIMVILRQSKQISKHGRVSYFSLCGDFPDSYAGMIFEELGSFEQQADLYKQKLDFECRQSGPITFQN